MIIVEHLSKSYHRKTVVQDLSFAVPEGNVFALLGSNGSRKKHNHQNDTRIRLKKKREQLQCPRTQPSAILRKHLIFRHF